MSGKLPPMPSEDGRCDWGYYDEWRHAEAVAHYWEARCMVAVEALQKIKALGYSHGDCTEAGISREALALIGPLPAKEEPK